MVSDQPNDPLGVSRANSCAGILEAAREVIDPEPTVRVQHHLDDARVLQMTRDQRAERGAQHARPSRNGL
jgi:hypothetical protein